MECQYCKKTFSTKPNLKTHQTKAKYCLKIQGEISKQIYKCKYCYKTFNRKDNYCVHLTTHENNEELMNYHQELEKFREIIRTQQETINIKDVEIENYQQNNIEQKKLIKKQDFKITELEQRLENVAIKVGSRPTTVNNQFNIVFKNKETLSNDHSDRLISMITPDVICNPNISQIYGNIFYEVIKDTHVLYDMSRGKTVSKITNGLVEEKHCKIIKGKRYLIDYRLFKTIKSLVDEEKAKYITDIIYEESKKVMAGHQTDLDLLGIHNRQMNLFKDIVEDDIVNEDLAEAIRHCYTKLQPV